VIQGNILCFVLALLEAFHMYVAAAIYHHRAQNHTQGCVCAIRTIRTIRAIRIAGNFSLAAYCTHPLRTREV
jgi:hypothetical protein